MLKGFNYWLVGKPQKALTSQESKAATALFFIFAFSLNILPPNFSFAGTVESSGEGNIFIQVFWIAIFFLSLSMLWIPKRPVGGVIFKAMPLLFFCLYLIVSTLWSLEPEISIRRAVLELIVVASILVTIASLQNTNQTFIILYRVAAITLTFEFIMLFRANGFDEVGIFRGIHSQKNVLGLVCAIAIFTGVWTRECGVALSKYWNITYLVGWLAILILSQSKTSLGLILLAPVIAFGLRRIARYSGSGVGVPLLVILGVFYTLFAVAFISGVDVGREIGGWIHRVGFTGRDSIWDFLIARFLERPWMGHGYGGFWDIGVNSPNVRYGIGFITQINQAHNGYLDLLLALGIVGFIAYIAVVVGYFNSLAAAEHNVQNGTLALCWVFFIFSILHNLTETTLLRGYASVWVMQLIAMSITYRLAYESNAFKVNK
jgi:O-antigen ligase